LLEFQNTIWHHKHNVDFLVKKDFELKGKMEFVLTEIERSLSELEKGD